MQYEKMVIIVLVHAYDCLVETSKERRAVMYRSYMNYFYMGFGHRFPDCE